MAMSISNRRLLLVVPVFLMLLLVLTLGTLSGENHNPEGEKLQVKLDKILSQFKKVYQVPGMVVGVLKDGEVIYGKGFGVRRLGKEEPVTIRSLFHMASVSKTFAATAVMQLVEKGKLNLEKKLVDYLPYFKMSDECYQKITIGQMLNHTSGIPDVRDYEWDKPQYDDGAAERYIRSLAGEKMIFAPGERFRYSNMAYDILADVIARVSGKTFETYVKDHILNPLDMKDSTFLKKEVPGELENAPHVYKDRLSYQMVVSNVYPYNRAHAPSSTLHSNVRDMLLWADAYLKGGILNGKRILKAETITAMWKPQIKAWQDYYVGVSWFIGKHKGFRTISHSGGDVGFRTRFIIMPEKSLAVVTMGNSESYDSLAVVLAVLDILLGYEANEPKAKCR